jgi:hypothetical protein
VTDSNLTREDGSHAKYIAVYKWTEIMLRRLMLESPHYVDIVFVVGSSEGPPFGGSTGPIYYNHRVTVQPVTMNKYNSDGSLKVDGQTLLAAATAEVKKVIRENPLGSLRDVGGRTEDVQRGSGLIYGDTSEIEYKQFVSKY